MASRYVRLKVLKNKKPKQYALAHKYFIFLGKRTKSRYKDLTTFTNKNGQLKTYRRSKVV